MPNRDSVQTWNEFAGLTFACVSLFGVLLLATNVSGQKRLTLQRIPDAIMLRIVKAEDERRWDRDLGVLLSDKDPAVRRRAALAAGRIGNHGAVRMLIPLLEKDSDLGVRAMAGFALGEIESGDAIKALNDQIDIDTQPTIRARAVEALGKIAAALPKTEEAQANAARAGIMRALELEAGRRSAPDFEVIELGITAALRARPEGAGSLIARFLRYPDPIPAIAANALARLRAKEGNAELSKLLASAKDPELRANAARVLGATEDKTAFAALVDRATYDSDSRVRISAIRALAALKDPRATKPLRLLGANLQAMHRSYTGPNKNVNELLEVATALSRTAAQTNSQEVINILEIIMARAGWIAPEVDIAIARVWPERLIVLLQLGPPDEGADWRAWSARAQGVGELANITTRDPLEDASNKSEAVRHLRNWLSCSPAQAASKPARMKTRTTRDVGARCNPIPVLAVPDVLRAYAAFKQSDTADVLRKQLTMQDVIVRATAAELVGELPPDPANADALTKAFEQASRDKLNDARLAILEALGKQKTASANEILKSALYSGDYLIRVRAAGYLKDNGVSDFSPSTSSVATGKSNEDYQRAIARIGKDIRARVVTSRGAFTIELLPEDAPLNVDNFIKLARNGYFRGITFHRVVPNFVVQGGDPRGDGNGGPGYSVRCEINEVPYGRGAVGMALSGKDTGGSQWFVTHSSQPHLDGGYTVFGRVVSGVEVVDEIIRGDVIRSVTVTEANKRANRNALSGNH